MQPRRMNYVQQFIKLRIIICHYEQGASTNWNLSREEPCRIRFRTMWRCCKGTIHVALHYARMADTLSIMTWIERPPASVTCAVEHKGRTKLWQQKQNKLHGLSPRANYTDRATAACRRSDWQLLRTEGCHVVSVTDQYGRILRFLDRSRYFSIKELLSCTHEAECTPFQIHYFFFW
jgi:hypothetical protein